MANIVTNIIKVYANEETLKSIDDRFENAGGYNDIAKFATSFYDSPDINESGALMNSWSLDHIGSKWAYVENAIDEGEWNVASANYPPHEFLQRLFELVTELDPNGYIENRYNDETYSPVGVQVFKKDSNGVPKYSEDEDYDMENPTDDMDWDDEGYDDAQSEFMDAIYDYHESSIQGCHDMIDMGDGKDFKVIEQVK